MIWKFTISYYVMELHVLCVYFLIFLYIHIITKVACEFPISINWVRFKSQISFHNINMFYGPQGHPYDCFPMELIYMYILVSLTCMRCCIRSKKVTSFQGLGQLMGVVCNQMNAIERWHYKAIIGIFFLHISCAYILIYNMSLYHDSTNRMYIHIHVA